MPETIGDDSTLRTEILAAGQAKKDQENDTGACRHEAGLSDNGPMELTSRLKMQYPDGVRLATCKKPDCRTTIKVVPHRWKQL